MGLVQSFFLIQLSNSRVYVSDIPFRPVTDYTRVASFLSDLL